MLLEPVEPDIYLRVKSVLRSLKKHPNQLDSFKIREPKNCRENMNNTKNGDPKVAVVFFAETYAALNNLCGSITNFFGTPASNSPYPSGA
jgi:hypothetical protein